MWGKNTKANEIYPRNNKQAQFAVRFADRHAALNCGNQNKTTGIMVQEYNKKRFGFTFIFSNMLT